MGWLVATGAAFLAIAALACLLLAGAGFWLAALAVYVGASVMASWGVKRLFDFIEPRDHFRGGVADRDPGHGGSVGVRPAARISNGIEVSE